MCTEAALNAVQRVYPQLYTSWDKYIIDAKKIQVVAADFLKAMKSMVPFAAVGIFTYAMKHRNCSII